MTDLLLGLACAAAVLILAANVIATGLRRSARGARKPPAGAGTVPPERRPPLPGPDRPRAEGEVIKRVDVIECSCMVVLDVRIHDRAETHRCPRHACYLCEWRTAQRDGRLWYVFEHCPAHEARERQP